MINSIDVEIKKYFNLLSDSLSDSNLKKREEILDKVSQIWNSSFFINTKTLSNREVVEKLSILAEQLQQHSNAVLEDRKQKKTAAAIGTQSLESQIIQKEKQLFLRIQATAKAVNVGSEALQALGCYLNEFSREKLEKEKSWASFAIEHLSDSKEFSGSYRHVALENTLELFTELEQKYEDHIKLLSLKEEIKIAAEYGKLLVADLQNLEVLIGELFNKIHSLSQGKAFTLPIGWLEHAIMLRITKEANNNFNFKIYNEGEGVNLHGSQFTDELGKTKYEIVYEIPNIDKEKVSHDLLYEIIRHLIIGKGPNRLYKEILPKLGEQKKTTPDTDPTRWSHLQLGGSCISQSVKGMIKDILGIEGIEEYRSYKKNIRLHVAHKVLDVAQKNNISSSKKALLKEILSKLEHLEKTDATDASEKQKIEDLRQEIQDIELRERMYSDKNLKKSVGSKLYSIEMMINQVKDIEMMINQVKYIVTEIFTDGLFEYFADNFELTDNQEKELEKIIYQIRLDDSKFTAYEFFLKLYKNKNLSEIHIKKYLVDKATQSIIRNKEIFATEWLSSLNPFSFSDVEEWDLNKEKDLNMFWNDIEQKLPDVDDSIYTDYAEEILLTINTIKTSSSLEKTTFAEDELFLSNPNREGYLRLHIALLFMQKFREGGKSHKECKEALFNLSKVYWDMKQLNFEQLKKMLFPVIESFLEIDELPNADALTSPNIDLFAGLAQILYKNNMHKRGNLIRDFCVKAQRFYLQLSIAKKFQDSPWRNDIKLMFQGSSQGKFH